MRTPLSTISAAGLMACIFAMALPDTLGAAEERPARKAASAASSKERRKQTAEIRPVGGGDVKGTVLVEKTARGVRITAKIGGLKPDSIHAIRIQNADGMAGGTPARGKFAGGPEAGEARKPGDLGNLMSDSAGNATHILEIEDPAILSQGFGGRLIVIDSKASDDGDPAIGGLPIAAGIVGK